MKTDLEIFLEMTARAGISPCFQRKYTNGSNEFQFDNGGDRYAASITFDSEGKLKKIVGCGS